MDIERITTAVRPRSPWEAMDLGFHMLRRWWLSILIPWLCTLSAFSAAILIPLRSWPLLSLTLLWLGKPLYDRVPLFVLSRALFGAPPGWRESLGALPRLLGNDLGWTLLHRVDLVRAFNLPVRQLEGLRGADARRRMRVLQKATRSHAAGLTGLFMILELIGFVSILWAIPMLLPEGVDENLLELLMVRGASEGWLVWVLIGAYLLTLLVLEPFYVAAGFALYLNRRTDLEAWDVELRFRRLTHRLSPEGLLAGCLALLVFATVLPPEPARAETPYQPAPLHPGLRPEADAKEVIGSVLDEPAFDRQREVELWRYRSAPDKDKGGGLPALGIGRLLASLTEAALWGVLLVGVVLLLVHRKRWMSMLAGPPPPDPRPEAPPVLFGLDVRPESLPLDPSAAARTLLRDGRTRDALALLYRGALAGLIHDRHLPLGAADTEGECLAKLKRRIDDGALSRYFGELTALWRETAYGHRAPGAERALRLVEGWNEHFGGRS